ncbi:MAG: hypothetical protein LBB18_03340 [Puniceicoccales bacterium]|jgi:hypothetical protein|nr:hypothetical protein [Puniceicoccales bacterium]
MVRKEKGVAFVFVILTILLVGSMFSNLTVLHYIEILRLGREKYAEKAKENALFALGLAVEKLQRLSGKDTRATASASLFPDIGDHRRYHVGVWDSSDAEISGEPKFLGWMVSGSNSERFDSIFRNGGTASEGVKIFSASGPDDVFIPPCKVMGGKDDRAIVGQYGFWICDESQKIKINLVDFYAKSTDSRAKRIRHRCPQTFDTNVIFGKNVAAKNELILSKIDFPEQLECLDKAMAWNFRQNRHSLTLHSSGVLSNARKGGLRTDLTQLARTTPPGFDREQCLFERQTDLPAHIPTLNFLLSFLNLSNGKWNGQLPVLASAPLFRPQFLVDYDGLGAPVQDLLPPDRHGIYPLLAQANVSVGIAKVGGNFAVTLLPQIVLWNPYNVDLQITDYTVELCVPSGNRPYEPCVALWFDGSNGRQLEIIHLAHADQGNGMAKILRLRFSTGLLAGEIKIFSPQGTQTTDLDRGNFLSNVDNLSNFFHGDTRIPAGTVSTITASCTDETGNRGSQWNCFYWRLCDGKSGEILQEIAELDPSEGGNLECERRISSANANCFSFCSRMKYGNTDDAAGETGVRWLANCNPRAPYVNRAVCQEYQIPFAGRNSAPGNWNYETSLAETQTAVRLDNKMINFLSNLILFDVPDDTCGVLNIGFLRHVNFLPFGYFSSQIFGSSRANPMIPLTKTFHANLNIQAYWPSRRLVESLYDYSYLLNEAIFDQYFVSTAGGNGVIDGSLENLANRRFKFLNAIPDGGKNDPARRLLIDGVFNVNSCNSIAWQCALSGVKNDRGEVIFPRSYSEKSLARSPSFGEERIENLAQRIVSVIRERGSPFIGIGNFANRKISPSAANCTASGALQRAMDLSKINADGERTNVNFSKNLPIYDDVSASGYLEENMPDVVNQADILQTMSHFLCTRGDTFLIRCFGDGVDPSGKIMDRAYCEAILQRMPEYVNGTENDPEDAEAALSTVNEKFGRRYRIILFRWLGKDEI